MFYTKTNEKKSRLQGKYLNDGEKNIKWIHNDSSLRRVLVKWIHVLTSKNKIILFCSQYESISCKIYNNLDWNIFFLLWIWFFDLFKHFCLTDSLELLTAAAHIRELQDKLNSTAEALHHQKVLNQHLQLQISSTSQECTTDNLEAALTVDKILQQEERVPGLFLYYTNLKYPTFVTLLELLTYQHIQRKGKISKGWIQHHSFC